MKPSESYQEIEEFLKSRQLWETRIHLIEEQQRYLAPFTERLERLKMDKDAVDVDERESRQLLENYIVLLERNQTHLYVYNLRIMILNITVGSLSEEDQEFVQLAYTELLSKEKVMEHLSISNSTFFRRRVEIAENVRLLLGESDDFLREMLPKDVQPHIERFFSDEWFLKEKLTTPDYRSPEWPMQEQIDNQAQKSGQRKVMEAASHFVRKVYE